MRNRWNDADTAGMDEVDLLVYQSHLIGAEPSLVLWGGGNTSLKLDVKDFRGRTVRAMVVKGPAPTWGPSGGASSPPCGWKTCFPCSTATPCPTMRPSTT